MRVILGAAVLLVSASAALADSSAVVSAIQKRDAKALAAAIELPLHLRRLTFPEACAKFSGDDVEVDAAALPELVTCLADLKVTALTGPDDRFVTAVYGPGFPMMMTGKPGIHTIYSFNKPGAKSLQIEPATFASHVKKFSREVTPNAALKATLDESGGAIEARILICAVSKTEVQAKADVILGGDETYAADVVAAVKKWSITPFAFAKQPIVGCSTFNVGYPAARIETPMAFVPLAPPPPPASGPQNVSPSTLEGNRISGTAAIAPDDADKTAIRAAKVDRVIASYKLCLGADGHPTSVTALKASGYVAYDAKIARTMKSWVYRPYVVDGQATAVCTAVTFVYAQH